MAISKDRMEKELAAQKYRAEKIEKEALAQKRKAEAIAHLETQGQRVEGVIGFSKKMEPKTSDNTLALLLNRKAMTTGSEIEKIKEQQAKATLLKQQDDVRRARELKTENDSLPPSWQSVLDTGSNSYYYWNRVTNETSWTKPEVVASDEISITVSADAPSAVEATVVPVPVDALLSGWEARQHPATNQTYYVNLTTNETRSIKPTLNAPSSSSSSVQIADHSALKRPGDYSNEQSSKYRRQIDPLDFEGQLDAGNRNGRKTDKMADSTASGPLWQQRPYPAPGTIMRAMENSHADVGPSMGPGRGQGFQNNGGQGRGGYQNNGGGRGQGRGGPSRGQGRGPGRGSGRGSSAPPSGVYGPGR